MRIVLGALAAGLALAGCASVEQRVTPVSRVELKQICIIENPRVRQTFLAAMQDALRKRGFEVRMLPENTSHSACPLVAQYVARWQWDLALYMAYADIKVFQEEKQVGAAIYNATAVVGPSKFINAEEKVNELINQLFPQ